MKRRGAVLVFKPGTSEREAVDALRKIEAVLGYLPTVHEFDPAYGGPVWYIP